jgi:hypothetical protein
MGYNLFLSRSLVRVIGNTSLVVEVITSLGSVKAHISMGTVEVITSLGSVKAHTSMGSVEVITSLGSIKADTTIDAHTSIDSVVISSLVNSFHVPALDLESDNRSSSYSLVNVVESIKIICAGISKFLGIGAAGHTDVNDIKNDGYNAKHLLLANGSASSHIIHTGL